MCFVSCSALRERARPQPVGRGDPWCTACCVWPSVERPKHAVVIPVSTAIDLVDVGDRGLLEQVLRGIGDAEGGQMTRGGLHPPGQGEQQGGPSASTRARQYRQPTLADPESDRAIDVRRRSLHTDVLGLDQGHQEPSSGYSCAIVMPFVRTGDSAQPVGAVRSRSSKMFYHNIIREL